MSEGVEWAVHACTVLALLPEGAALPAPALAEYHEVPGPYLAKHLQALSAAGIVTSARGRRGGYRLARPAEEVSVLDVVLAVEGDEAAFTCTEVRRRGPVAAPPEACRRPCGIAATMWAAEQAWRDTLAATTVADLVADLLDHLGTTLGPEALVEITGRAGAWLQEHAR